MVLAPLIWVGGGLLKRVWHFFGNEPSLGRKSPILHLPGESSDHLANQSQQPEGRPSNSDLNLAGVSSNN